MSRDVLSSEANRWDDGRGSGIFPADELHVGLDLEEPACGRAPEWLAAAES